MINKPNNNDIAIQIANFSGDEKLDIKPWLENIESLKNLYNISDIAVKSIAVSKLTVAAQKYYFSLHNYPSLSWNEFRNKMLTMFKIEVDHLSLMNALQNLKWRNGEVFRKYFHNKVLIANKLKLSSV